MSETLATSKLNDGRCLRIRTAGVEDAPLLREIIVAAFANRPALDPRPSALDATNESIAAMLEHGFGIIAYVDEVPFGVIIVSIADKQAGIHHVSVSVSMRQLGVASAMIDAVLAKLSEYDVEEVHLVAREEFPQVVDWWKRRGFIEYGRVSPFVKLRRQARISFQIPTAAAMGDFGKRLAKLLRPGDLIIAAGELGAGKTTLAQGIGAGLDVEGSVISPTFVISRIHRAKGSRPGLLHVDAYRLSGWEELDDLDLQTEDLVTFVEWGTAIAERLAEDRLEIDIQRSPEYALESDDEPRWVFLTPIGERWDDLRAQLES